MYWYVDLVETIEGGCTVLTRGIVVYAHSQVEALEVGEARAATMPGEIHVASARMAPPLPSRPQGLTG